MKQFLKAEDLQLINGGYLANKESNPVTHEEFVKAQKHAQYIIKYAEVAKTKNFKESKVDSVKDLEKEVLALLANDKVDFVEKPSAVKGELTEKLAAEAMAFMSYRNNSNKAEKVNEFLQQFKILKEFEDFGLFFDQGVTKLTQERIYTVKEIITAVNQVIDIL